MEGGDKLFVSNAHQGPAAHLEFVADAIVVTGKLLLPTLDAQFPMQCRDGTSPRCLLLASSPAQPLPVSCPVPCLHFKLLPLCFHLFRIFCHPLKCLSICLPTIQSPCSHHSWLTESPTCLCRLLVCLLAAFPLPWALLPPSSVFPLIVHVGAHLFKHKCISH